MMPEQRIETDPTGIREIPEWQYRQASAYYCRNRLTSITVALFVAMILSALGSITLVYYVGKFLVEKLGW